MDAAFYRSFEDLYRGSRELILGRLRVYESFLKPLIHSAEASRQILDLGCGRGEWLELARGLGFSGVGVDVDEEMLRASLELGLDARKSDALQMLRATRSESLSVVSAFHLVEHLPFEEVCELIQESLRVLEPGGLLILETPNPDNMRVASKTFHIDPSHIKPLPCELLSFVVQHLGFQRAKTVPLQEPEPLHDPGYRLHLLDVFEAVSPDYSIIGQKQAGEDYLRLFDSAFLIEYGTTFSQLANKYHDQIYAELRRLAASEADLKSRVVTLEAIVGITGWRYTKPWKLLRNAWLYLTHRGQSGSR